MKKDSKYAERDQALPSLRQQLLDLARKDLEQDADVLAVYLAGSLAKENADNYSDIDLHTIVKPEKLASFIANKKERARRWGNVLFFEGNASSPAIDSHFDCFVKVDSWYHREEGMEPSVWLKGMKILYDPSGMLETIRTKSEEAVYKITACEVDFWRAKMLAFIHETYRAAMRGEPYYALANLDSVRWLMASGWYMEMGQHLDSPYQVWSKIEGARSRLNEQQLQLLADWQASRDPESILQALESLSTEFVRLNKTLSRQAGIEDEGDMLDKAISIVL